MSPAMRKAWNWLKNDMAYKPPEQLGTAEEIALMAFSFGWAKGSANAREECATFAADENGGQGIADHIRARGNE